MHHHPQERDNHVIHNSRVRGRRSYIRNNAHPLHSQALISTPQYWRGRYVPIGFAAFESPIISLLDYKFFTFVGFRVAILRSMPNEQINMILTNIYRYGPQSVGYVRVYDTLVPASLGPGDRMILAGAGDW